MLDTSLKEMEDFGQRIGVATVRMMEMVQNLLDANRIERGEMNLDLAPCDLCPVLNSVIETQRSARHSQAADHPSGRVNRPRSRFWWILV